jgi:hypothetical protein
MINLAGNKNADQYVKEELYLAGIEAIEDESDSRGCGEVPYTIIGRIGYWTFRRAWYYWVASVKRPQDGLILETAVKLHETLNPVTGKKLGESIRSGGHCGCPSPAEYGADPIYDDEFNEQLKKLGYKEEKFFEKTYIPITVSEVSKLCNEGKLKVKRYVDCYHIDDQIGLNELAKVLKNGK